MAAGLLWILDASINITMEPFRAFVADKLNADQRTTGFVMQSFFIGLGATFAGWLPLAFRRFGVSGNTDSGIPLTLKYAFQLGAAAFLLAVIWTVFTTKEYPPEDMEAFEQMRREKKGLAAGLTEIITALREMPKRCGNSRRADLHLAGTLLHVVILRAGGCAPRLWRGRSAV